MATRRVLITGQGAVSPLGGDTEALWQGLLAGRICFRTLEHFDASVFRNPQAGQVDGYPEEPGGQPRAVRMLLDAVAQALQQSLGTGSPADRQALKERAGITGSFARAALVAGTNFGGLSAVEQALFTRGYPGDELVLQAGGASPSLARYLFGNAGLQVARSFGLGGPRLNLSLSCASGAAAIGVACDLIRAGRVQVAVAAGYDELSLFAFAGLSALRAVTPETVRPFDRRRKGTLFSEGAGAVVLESEEHLQARGGPPPLAEVQGRATNNDGYHMTAPEQEATGIRKLMRAALADAGCSPERIDHVNLHATGTPYNDKMEALALREVFGARGTAIPVCAVKSSIGHTMGAAGVLESIVAVRTLREGLVPPVLGLDPAQQDPECNLLVSTQGPLRGEFRTVLKTSYGFGGTNAALVLGKV